MKDKQAGIKRENHRLAGKMSGRQFSFLYARTIEFLNARNFNAEKLLNSE